MKYTLYIMCFCLSACSERKGLEFAIEADRLPVKVFLSEVDSADSPVYLHHMKSGQTFPCQFLSDSTWVFIPTIGSTETGIFEIVSGVEQAENVISFTKTPEYIEVEKQGRPVFRYNHATISPPSGEPSFYRRSGFIHPAYSPSGKVLTDGFPEGHTHQHGIFFAWVNTVFKGYDTDFWNQQDETGNVRFSGIHETTEGAVFGRLVTEQEHVSYNGSDTTVVLREEWDIMTYNTPDAHVWDMNLRQQNVSSDTLFILPYHYGGMAYRGSAEWNERSASDGVEGTGPGMGRFLTSDGDTRTTGNHTRPAWAALTGLVDDQPVSLKIIPEAENFRYPEFVRIHPSMPYFCFVSIVEDGLNIAPGEVFSASYRFVAGDGELGNQ